MSEFLEPNFRAFTDTTVCPDLVDPRVYGFHSSTVIDGQRVWAFERGTGRDAFMIAVEKGSFRREKK